MLARGAIANPFLMAELTNTSSNKKLKNYIVKHIELMREIYLDKKATAEFRKFVPYYFKGMEGVKELKLQLVSAQCTEQLIELIERNL
jgi:tRNA-dihydrouridine synthase